MNARFVFACAATGLALTAFGATTASAEESNTGNLGFFDNPARPGQEVGFFGGCDDPDFVSAKLVSDALTADEAFGTDDGEGGWKFQGAGTVPEDTKPGEYPVSYQCGTTTVTAPLTVVADEPGDPAVALSPNKGKKGDRIKLNVRCAELPTVTSAAMDISDLRLLPEGSVYVGEGVVKDVEPGAYEVTANCGGEDFAATFTVVASTVPATDNQVPVKPKGPADTGSVDAPVAAPAAQDSTNTGLLIGAGVALAVVAGGAGALAYRRRQRES
jgi:hypothetical protein